MKSLKAKLSEHLRFVKAGETILVTERDEVIAELRPARGRLPAEGSLVALLATLAESGDVTPPLLPKRGWALSAGHLGLPPGTAAELLDQVRSERE